MRIKLRKKEKSLKILKKKEKKQIKNKNRKSHDLIIKDQLQNEEKKKIEEKNRKMQIKKQLEDKIKKEMDLKNFFKSSFSHFSIVKITFLILKVSLYKISSFGFFSIEM